MMKERIKELLQQAHTKTRKYNDDHSIAFDVTNFDIEKFAELIVKECAEVAYKKHQPLAGKFIKEHFGVE
jgi:hypothetical protein